MQNQNFPSLLHTRTNAEAHGLVKGLVAQSLTFPVGVLQTSSNMDWGIGQYLSQNGCEFGSNLISCSTTEVSPRFRSWQENTSSNSDNKSTASWQSSGDQDAHPNRSIWLSIVLSGDGTFGLVLAGNQVRFSLQPGVGAELSKLSLFGVMAPITKYLSSVTSANMSGTSFAACIWPMTHQTGMYTFFRVRFCKQILTLLEPGLRSQYVLVATTSLA